MPHPILSNMGPVTITTAIHQNHDVWSERIGIWDSPKKLNSQFVAVDKAFAGARIRSGVTSAG